MEYKSPPIHEFLMDRIKVLSNAKAAHSFGYIWGPFGERYAAWEVKVEVKDDKLYHIMCQVKNREGVVFSVNAQILDGVPSVTRMVGASIVNYQILINEIEAQARDSLMRGQLKKY